MIPSLIFSLLAFFIVATTTVVVIKNKSKVNAIDKSFATTKVEYNNDKHSNHTRLNNLVNEINLNHKKLENNQNETKTLLQNENRKSNAKLDNLDKRFNSYKNITTANFMGMNNRMTSENQRLKDDIALNHTRIQDNKRFTESNIATLSNLIGQQQTTFRDFYSSDYSTNIDRLDAMNLVNSSNLTAFRDELSSAIIDSSNMNLSARAALNTIVNSKYDDVNRSLSYFFNTGSNFIDDNKARANDSSLFRNWIDSYYNLESRSNFKTMDDLILLADSNTTRISDNRAILDQLKSTVSQHSSQLNVDSNLYKNNLSDYIKDTYNFDLVNLASIASNANQINMLNSNISTLSNTLKSIGIFDVRTEGTITLDDLYQSIQSNQSSIQSNQLQIQSLFDNKFNDYLGSNLDTYYNDISLNINPSDIVSKLNGADITLSNVNVQNDLDVQGSLDVLGNLYISGYDVKSNIEKNKNYVNTLEKVFDLNNVQGKSIGTVDYVQKTPPLMSFTTNNKTNNEIALSTGNQGEGIDLKPGTDLQLSRKNYYATKVGGKIFVDSFDDIGLNDYDDLTGFRAGIDGTTKRYKFKESLGDKLRNIGSNISELNESISNVQSIVANDGISKSQLYNVINNVPVDKSLEGNYGRGPYNDMFDTSFRIDNLYTGNPGNTTCFANGVQNDSKQCKTIDQRLSSLENANEGLDLLSPGISALNEFGFTKTSDTKINLANSLNVDASLTVKDQLSVSNTGTSVKNLNVSGDLTVGSGISRIVLNDVDDIGVQAVGASTSYVPLSQTFVHKGKNEYIKNISSDSSGFTFTYGDNSTGTVAFPNGPANTVEDTDLKKLLDDSAVNGSSGTVASYRFKNYNSSATGSLTDTVIDVPKKYVRNITTNPDGSYTVKNVDTSSSRFGTNDITIQPGISSRQEIINKLAEEPRSPEIVRPSFGNGILLGDNCLKTFDNRLHICDNQCANCHEIWDHDSAPKPITNTSPIAAS